MAKFSITAHLNLQTPNLTQTINNLRQQFQGANLKINITNLAKTQNAMTNLNKSAQATSKSFNSLGNSIGASAKKFAGMAFATGTFVGLTRAIKNSVSEAIEFEREMVKISQAAGKSMSALKSLQDEIGAVSQAFGVSSKELVGATRNLVQAGFAADKVRDALKLLAQTELSGTFDSIADTTEGVIALLNQFGQQAQKSGTEIEFLEKSLSAISKVSKDFAVESSDLITTIRTTGSAFQSAGGDLNELIALFTSVRATTRESAESIATGFRTIFTRVQRVDTINTLKELGIELQDINGKFVGPMEAVKRLSVALNTIDPRDFRFNVIVEELGGFRQVSKVIPLIQQFGTAQKALGVAQKSSGDLAKDAASAQQALGVQITKTREEFQAFIRELTGSASFKETVSGALQMASAFIKIADSLKPLLPLITSFAAIKLGSAVMPAINSFMGKRKGGGGPIGFASGGLVPGSGNGDTVPAMLTPGEFVIKKNSVKSIGVENLASMNKYAGGGRVTIFPKPNKYGVFALQPLGAKDTILRGKAKVKNKTVEAELAKRAKHENASVEIAADDAHQVPAFYIGGDDAEKSQAMKKRIEQVTKAGFKKIVSVISETPDFSLGTPPLQTDKSYFNRAIKSLFDKDNSAKSTIEGYVLEAVTASLGQIELGGGTSNWDFPNLGGKGKKLSQLFGLDKASLISSLISGDAKRSISDKALKSVLGTKIAKSLLEDQSQIGATSYDASGTGVKIESSKAIARKKQSEVKEEQKLSVKQQSDNFRKKIVSIVGEQFKFAESKATLNLSKFQGGDPALLVKSILGPDMKGKFGANDFSLTEEEQKKVLTQLEMWKISPPVNLLQEKALGGLISKFAKGGAVAGLTEIPWMAGGGGVKNAPLVDDILQATGAILPHPVNAIQAIINAGGGAVDMDRTLKRTIGDQAYAKAPTKEAQAEVLKKYFRNDAARLEDVKSAPLTQFGKALKQAIESGQINPRKMQIISKSGRTPGLAEYLSSVFGIPTANMIFTEGKTKQPALDALRQKGPRADRVSRFAIGGVAQNTQSTDSGIFDSDMISGGTNVKNALLQSILGSGKPYSVISGPAGSGKTTFAKSKFGNNFVLSEQDLLKYSSFVILSGAGKTKSGDLSPDAQRIMSGAKNITLLSPNEQRLMEQRQKRVDLATAAGSSDQRSVGALQGTLKAPTSANADLFKRYNNVQVLTEYAAGGAVGTDTVPAMLTPGEFVINKKSAQAIGYSNLHRMNNVGKYAKGGLVGVQKFGIGGDVDNSNSNKLLSLLKSHPFSFAPTTLIGKISRIENIATILKDIESAYAIKNAKIVGSGAESIVFDIGKKILKISQNDDVYNLPRISGVAAYSKVKKFGPLTAALQQKMNLDKYGTPEDVASLKEQMAKSGRIWSDAHELNIAYDKKNIPKIIDGSITKIAQHKANGGSVGTDTVPAMLTPGEFVINKKSAEKIGYSSLNRMNKVDKFAKGGPVGVQHFATGGPAAQPTGASLQTLVFLGSVAGTLATEFSDLSDSWKRAIESGITSFGTVKYAFDSASESVEGFATSFKGTKFGSFLKGASDGLKNAGLAMGTFSAAANGYAAKLSALTAELNKSVQSSLEKLEKTGGGTTKEEVVSKYRQMGENIRYETAARESTSMSSMLMGAALSAGVGAIGRRRRKFSYGGNVDTVPAMLTAGEYVIRREAVDHYGPDFLDSVNSGKYEGGGQVRGYRFGSSILRRGLSRAPRRFAAARKIAAKNGTSIGKDVGLSVLEGAVSAAPGAVQAARSYQSNADMPENFAKLGEAAYNATKGLNEFSKISEKLGEASVEKISQTATSMSTEISNLDKSIAAANDMFKKTNNPAYLDAVNDLTERSSRLSSAFEKLSGELRTRTIKSITGMAQAGRAVSEQDINDMAAQSGDQIYKSFEGRIATLKERAATAKTPEDEKAANDALIAAQKEQYQAVEENKKLIIDATAQVYKQEAALKREEEARNALIGTIAQEKGMRMAAEKANYLFQRSGTQASRIGGDFTKFSAIPDAKSLSLDSKTKDLGQSLSFVSKVMGSEGQKLAKNFLDLQDASNIVDTAFVELDRGLGANIDYGKFFEDYFKSQTGRGGGDVTKIVAQFVDETLTREGAKKKGVTPGTLGATGAKEEVKSKIDNYRKNLEQQIQAIIEVFSNFEGELQQRLSGISESMGNVKDLQLESVDSLGKYMASMAKINNKELTLKQKDYLRQVRQTTLAGKAGGNSTALLEQIRTAQAGKKSLQMSAEKNPFGGGIEGIKSFNTQMMSLDQTINNSKQALKELADQSSRTADIMDEIEKAEKKRESVATYAKKFAFGSKEERAGMASTVQGLQQVMMTGDIDTVSDDMKKSIESLLDDFKDVQLAGGMTGGDISKQLQYNKLVQSGVNPMAARSIFTKSSPEEKLIQELQRTFAQEQQVREALANLEVDTQKQLIDSIVELTSVARGYLQEAQSNPEKIRGQAGGARDALAAQGIRGSGPLTAQQFDNLATALDKASQRIEQAIATFNPAKKALGGLIYRAGGGGFQPRGTDTVPAMLTPGEFVVKKSAVDAVGVDTLNQINHMAGGGFVGGRLGYVNQLMQRQMAIRQGMMQNQMAARQGMMFGGGGGGGVSGYSSRRSRRMNREAIQEQIQADREQQVAATANEGQGLMPNQRVATTAAGGTRVVTDVRNRDRRAEREARDKELREYGKRRDAERLQAEQEPQISQETLRQREEADVQSFMAGNQSTKQAVQKPAIDFEKQERINKSLEQSRALKEYQIKLKQYENLPWYKRQFTSAPVDPRKNTAENFGSLDNFSTFRRGEAPGQGEGDFIDRSLEFTRSAGIGLGHSASWAFDLGAGATDLAARQVGFTGDYASQAVGMGKNLAFGSGEKSKSGYMVGQAIGDIAQLGRGAASSRFATGRVGGSLKGLGQSMKGGIFTKQTGLYAASRGLGEAGYEGLGDLVGLASLGAGGRRTGVRGTRSLAQNPNRITGKQASMESIFAEWGTSMPKKSNDMAIAKSIRRQLEKRTPLLKSDKPDIRNIPDTYDPSLLANKKLSFKISPRSNLAVDRAAMKKFYEEQSKNNFDYQQFSKGGSVGYYATGGTVVPTVATEGQRRSAARERMDNVGVMDRRFQAAQMGQNLFNNPFSQFDGMQMTHQLTVGGGLSIGGLNVGAIGEQLTEGLGQYIGQIVMNMMQKHGIKNTNPNGM